MKRPGTAKTILNQRLQALEQEMTALRRNIRQVAKGSQKPMASATLTRLTPSGLSAGVGRAAPSAGINPPPPPTAGAEQAAPGATHSLTTGGGALTNGARNHDERFASYFMTGNLNGLRPLRKEQSIIRNRAIFMIILVALMIFWVVKLIF